MPGPAGRGPRRRARPAARGVPGGDSSAQRQAVADQAARDYFGLHEPTLAELAGVAHRYAVFRVVDDLEVAPGVFCLGPWGRTHTAAYAVRTDASWVLVDTGWAGDAARIRAAADRLFGGVAPQAILLTHVHPDHSGAASELARRWGCLVYLHPAELPIATGDFAAMQRAAGPLDRWVVLPVMRALGRRRRDALLTAHSLTGMARPLHPGGSVPGLPGWECVHTPGHTPGHVSYFHPSDRRPISGDALVTVHVNSLAGLLRARPGLSGPPWYTTWRSTVARASIGQLADLTPAVVAAGHGFPLTAPDTASQVRAFAVASRHGGNFWGTSARGTGVRTG